MFRISSLKLFPFGLFLVLISLLLMVACGGSSGGSSGGGASPNSDSTKPPSPAIQKSWVAQNSGVTSDLKSIAYGNSIFVAVGKGGALVKSADASIWTKPLLPAEINASADFTRVFWRNNQFIALAYLNDSTHTTLLIYSTDGNTWTKSTAIPWTGTTGLLTIEQSQNVQYYCTNESGHPFYQLDGTTETWRFAFGDFQCNDLKMVDASDILIVGAGMQAGGWGPVIYKYHTSDSTTTSVHLPDTSNGYALNSVAYDGIHSYLAVGERGGVLYSADPTTSWTAGTVGSDSSVLVLSRAVYANHVFAVVGGLSDWGYNNSVFSKGFIAIGTTADASGSYTDYTLDPSTDASYPQRVFDLAYGNGQFVGVGTGGAIVTRKQP